MIVCGSERIFCYDDANATVEKVKDGSQIIAMNHDLKTVANCNISIRKLSFPYKFVGFKVPFLRHEKIFYTKFGDNPIFSTIRGYKLMSKIGKNDLIKMYDGALALCKSPEVIDLQGNEWFEIKSDHGAFIIINDLYVLI